MVCLEEEGIYFKKCHPWRLGVLLKAEGGRKALADNSGSVPAGASARVDSAIYLKLPGK